MDFTLFILACPAVGFLLLALAGMRMSHRAAGLTGTLLMAVTTVLSGGNGVAFLHGGPQCRRGAACADSV